MTSLRPIIPLEWFSEDDQTLSHPMNWAVKSVNMYKVCTVVYDVCSIHVHATCVYRSHFRTYSAFCVHTSTMQLCFRTLCVGSDVWNIYHIRILHWPPTKQARISVTNSHRFRREYFGWNHVASSSVSPPAIESEPVSPLMASLSLCALRDPAMLARSNPMIEI